MIEDYLLPQRLSEKLKLKFLKPTLRLGEEILFYGFLVELPEAQRFREILWQALAPELGNFQVKAITPFPERGFPLLPVIIPEHLKVRGRVFELQGRILDFSQFSSMAGRFVIVEKLRSLRLHDYLLMESPGLDGRKIYNLLDASFPDRMRDVMLSYFLSSPEYLSRMGGCTLTFLDSMSEYYTSDFSAVKHLIEELSPLLRKEQLKVALNYNGEMDVSLNVSFKVKYLRVKDRHALRFYSLRRGREWEKSAVTESTVRMEELIGVSDVPFIPLKEEMQVYGEELKEYAVDIAVYALRKHMESPSLDVESVERYKERFLRKIEKEFPLINEAMRMGVVMDMASVNGFGEHLARLLNAFSRAEIGNPGEKVYTLYQVVLERIEDVMRDRIKREIAALSEKRRIERIINRVLWELNALRPEGWSYEYFEKKMRERGLEDRAAKVFEALVRENVVIRKNAGYVAISSL